MLQARPRRARVFARVLEQIRISSRMVRDGYPNTHGSSQEFADGSHRIFMVRRRILAYGPHSVTHPITHTMLSSVFNAFVSTLHSMLNAKSRSLHSMLNARQ